MRNRKTGTYYVQFRLSTKQGKLGRTRFSRNFKTKSGAIKFANIVRRKGGSFNVFFSESIIHDKVIRI